MDGYSMNGWSESMQWQFGSGGDVQPVRASGKRGGPGPGPPGGLRLRLHLMWPSGRGLTINTTQHVEKWHNNVN